VVTSATNRKNILNTASGWPAKSVLYLKMGKNVVMHGFCSWFTVTEGVLADKLSFMYSRVWSQVQGTEKTAGLLHPVGPRHGFSVVVCLNMGKKMMSCRVSVVGSRLRRVFWPLNLVYV